MIERTFVAGTRLCESEHRALMAIARQERRNVSELLRGLWPVAPGQGEERGQWGM